MVKSHRFWRCETLISFLLLFSALDTYLFEGTAPDVVRFELGDMLTAHGFSIVRAGLEELFLQGLHVDDILPVDVCLCIHFPFLRCRLFLLLDQLMDFHL